MLIVSTNYSTFAWLRNKVEELSCWTGSADSINFVVTSFTNALIIYVNFVQTADPNTFFIDWIVFITGWSLTWATKTVNNVHSWLTDTFLNSSVINFIVSAIWSAGFGLSWVNLVIFTLTTITLNDVKVLFTNTFHLRKWENLIYFTNGDTILNCWFVNVIWFASATFSLND